MLGASLRAALEALGRRLDAGPGAPFALALSGGGDSLALMLAARAFAEARGRPLVALHLDHRLQPASGEWAASAARAAARLAVPFVRLDWVGPKPAAGLPAAARAARHRLLAEAARERGARVLLVGHTLDDQLENALMRGAGAPVGPLQEWSPSPAWPEGRGLFLCRPLLSVRRAELRAWLRAEGLDWIEDPANADPRYARARARAALAEGAAAEPLAGADLRALAPLCRPEPWGGFVLDRAGLAAAPEPLALRLLQAALACAAGTPSLARPGRAQGLLRRIASQDKVVATLGGARLEAVGGEARLWREAGEAARGGLQPLPLAPGAAQVWDGRYEIQAEGEGWRVEPLRGRAARLAPADRRRLRAVPPAARPSLPVLGRVDAPGAPPRLVLGTRGAHIDEEDVRVRFRWLPAERFAGAAGLMVKETDIGAFARMADVPPPSYVGGGR